MDHDLGVDKKKDKRKIIKDLSFLLEKTAVPVHSNCAKYLLQEGKGEVLSDINEHFDIVYSLRQYDYEGRRINEYPEGKINNQSKKDIALIELLQTMRVKEKAWFNLSNQQIFRNQKKRSTYEQMEDLEEEIEDEEEPQTMREEAEIQQIVDRTGSHYELQIYKIQYKNNDDIHIKRRIFEQKKEEGKLRFGKKEYFQAAKIYKYLDSISTGLPKKVFSEEEIIEMDSLNINSKVNFMKCYFKMVENKAEIPEEIIAHAAATIDLLLKHTNDDPVTHFLNSKWLLKERYLDQAFKEAQKSYKLKATSEAQQLMLLIKEQKERKGKIKVVVQPQTKK